MVPWIWVMRQSTRIIIPSALSDSCFTHIGELKTTLYSSLDDASDRNPAPIAPSTTSQVIAAGADEVGLGQLSSYMSIFSRLCRVNANAVKTISLGRSMVEFGKDRNQRFVAAVVSSSSADAMQCQLIQFVQDPGRAAVMGRIVCTADSGLEPVKWSPQFVPKYFPRVIRYHIIQLSCSF